MSKARTKLVFFGNERLSSCAGYDRSPILETLLRENYGLEALILSQHAGKSRSKPRSASLETARRHGLRVIVVGNGTELERATRSLTSERAVLASFGLLLGPAVLEHFRSGIINVHPSLLPKHRGPTPIETALLAGDRETGISLMRIEGQLDAGGVYARAKLAIGERETKLELTGRLGELAANLLGEKLPLILSGELAARAQDDALATYTEKITAKPPAEFRDRGATYWEKHIRAFAGCPNNKFALGGRPVEIEEARGSPAEMPEDLAYDKHRGVLLARCRTGRLEIARLKPAARNSMAAGDFVNGFLRRIPVI